MQISAGIFLQATPLLDTGFFERAHIYIHQSDAEGAVGFIVNRIFHRKLNELLEFAGSKPVTLYDGGPVDREHLFFLHRRPDLIPGGRRVTDNTWWGGDFHTAVMLLNNNSITEKDIRVFIGYCGWDKEELEAEISEGSWQVIPQKEDAIFGI